MAISQIVVRGYGTFGANPATRGFGVGEQVARSTEVYTSVTFGDPRNNRVTVLAGKATMQYKERGENRFMSESAHADELGERFDDPRYYGREL